MVKQYKGTLPRKLYSMKKACKAILEPSLKIDNNEALDFLWGHTISPNQYHALVSAIQKLASLNLYDWTEEP